jgi:hypothetical protein
VSNGRLVSWSAKPQMWLSRVEKAWAASSIEKPLWRRVPSTASWWRRVAGPGEVRESISPIAQGWRDKISRAEMARWRMAVFQSTPAVGRWI